MVDEFEKSMGVADFTVELVKSVGTTDVVEAVVEDFVDLVGSVVVVVDLVGFEMVDFVTDLVGSVLVVEDFVGGIGALGIAGSDCGVEATVDLVGSDLVGSVVEDFVCAKGVLGFAGSGFEVDCSRAVDLVTLDALADFDEERSGSLCVAPFGKSENFDLEDCSVFRSFGERLEGMRSDWRLSESLCADEAGFDLEFVSGVLGFTFLSACTLA